MKTSNYIIIFYLVLLFSGVLALFVAARFNPQKNTEIDSFIVGEALNHFSVVVTESETMLIHRYGLQPEIFTSFDEGVPAGIALHEVRNDTLFIFNNPKSKPQFIQVQCPEIKSIIGKGKSKIRIDDYRGDSLTLKLEESELMDISANDENRISVLTLTADLSYVTMGAGIDKLEIDANRSYIKAYNNTIKSVTCSLKNYSRLELHRSSSLDSVNVDSTSFFQAGHVTY